MWQERMLGFKEREKRGCHRLLLMLPISFRKGKGARGATAEHDSGPLLLALSLQAPQTVPAFPQGASADQAGNKRARRAALHLLARSRVPPSLPPPSSQGTCLRMEEEL